MSGITNFIAACPGILYLNLAGQFAGEIQNTTSSRPNTEMGQDPLVFGNKAPGKLATIAGFRTGKRGTHSCRTMMLTEIGLLFDHCGERSTREEYAYAIVEDNCLEKRTVSNRRLSLQRLSELYALDTSVLLFRVFRLLWDMGKEGRPQLALLCSLARDPLLRVTAPTITAMKADDELARQYLTSALGEALDGRLNRSSLDKVVRNTSASWTQSGHLKGRGRKTRCPVIPTPASITYSLLLGYILGSRSGQLFETFWTSIFDVPASELRTCAMEAKRYGLLDMTEAGGIIEISFTRLLTDDERQLIHGAY